MVADSLVGPSSRRVAEGAKYVVLVLALGMSQYGQAGM